MTDGAKRRKVKRKEECHLTNPGDGAYRDTEINETTSQLKKMDERVRDMELM